MRSEPNFMLCLELAHHIIAAKKAEFGGADLLAFKVGGGVTNTDTDFSRSGTSDNKVNWTLPSALQDLVTSATSSAIPSSSLTGEASLRLSDLLTRDTAAVPAVTTINDTLAISPTSFDGAATLRNVANLDPTSTAYEADTLDAYKQRAADALGQLQSGHPAVRGGQTRSALAQGVAAERLAQGRGAELRDSKLADASVIDKAIQVLNGIEAQRRGLQLSAQQNLAMQTAARDVMGLDAAKTGAVQQGAHAANLTMASQLLGQKNNVVTDDLQGRGSQGTSSFGGEAGLSCCWIFLEHYRGRMPHFIRLCRDVLVTPRARVGYRRTAAVLVPLMRRFATIRWLVEHFMVEPITEYGGWLTASPGYDGCQTKGVILKRWMCFWTLLGSF